MNHGYRLPPGLFTIFSWWEEVENRGEDGPKKGGSGRAGGHIDGRRLLQAAIGLLLAPIMICCFCRGQVTRLVAREIIKNFFSCFTECYSRPLREPLLPTLLIVLRGVLVFGVVEVIRLLSTSQWRRVFLAGLSCGTLRRKDIRVFPKAQDVIGKGLVLTIN